VQWPVVLLAAVGGRPCLPVQGADAGEQAGGYVGLGVRDELDRHRRRLIAGRTGMA
jgi:hypothetical protein